MSARCDEAFVFLRPSENIPRNYDSMHMCIGTQFYTCEIVNNPLLPANSDCSTKCSRLTSFLHVLKALEKLSLHSLQVISVELFRLNSEISDSLMYSCK
jgi:hypothetical protein